MQILLYKLRKEHGLSQREMAKLINKSEVSYRNKELGKTDFTQSEMFIIAQHFNKELGDIFTPWTSRNVNLRKENSWMKWFYQIIWLISKEGGRKMEKIIAYSVEELYEKVAEQEKRISEIEMRLGIKPLEDTST